MSESTRVDAASVLPFPVCAGSRQAAPLERDPGAAAPAPRAALVRQLVDELMVEEDALAVDLRTEELGALSSEAAQPEVERLVAIAAGDVHTARRQAAFRVLGRRAPTPELVDALLRAFVGNPAGAVRDSALEAFLDWREGNAERERVEAGLRDLLSTAYGPLTLEQQELSRSLGT